MRYLLDTHAFLWTAARSKKLPQKTRHLIENANNPLFVSSISFWEIATKFRRGRLDLDGLEPIDFVDKAAAMEIEVIHLEPQEAATVNNLSEDTHFDPFDRMIIWQAISRGLTLISGDKEFKRFKQDGLKVLWK
jgi:PIN domain nuclease of toxin-antitoxin system